MSRNQARKRWHGRQIVDDLAERGITVRSPSSRGVAEDAPGAYQDVAEVYPGTSPFASEGGSCRNSLSR
jgi:tRNA-splicing ligase RtcB